MFVFVPHRHHLKVDFDIWFSTVINIVCIEKLDDRSFDWIWEKIDSIHHRNQWEVSFDNDIRLQMLFDVFSIYVDEVFSSLKDVYVATGEVFEFDHVGYGNRVMLLWLNKLWRLTSRFLRVREKKAIGNFRSIGFQLDAQNVRTHRPEIFVPVRQQCSSHESTWTSTILILVKMLFFFSNRKH